MRIVVDLEPEAAPITGRVSAGDDPSRPFVGWTGLFVALRAIAGGGRPLRDEDEPAPAPSNSGSGGTR